MSLASQAETAEQSTPGGHKASGAEKRPAGLPKRLWQTVQKTLDRLTQTNYHAAKTYYHHRLVRAEHRFQGRPPLLIYTMGKVGSSSVLHSLTLLKLDRALYHLHSLALESLHDLEESLKPAFPDSLVNLRHVWRCQHVANSLAQTPGARIQAISLIQVPLARNLSNFFQHIDVKPCDPTSGAGANSVRQWRLVSSFFDFDIVVSEKDTSALIELFFAKEWQDFPALWIDRELGGVLGIDVYDTEFQKNEGYAIYHSTKADLLLIRLQDLSRCAPQAIKEFMGIDTFSLVNANVGEAKTYVDVYRAFKAQIAFPESYLDDIYHSDFVRHFYSDAERQALRAQWTQA